MRKPSRQTLRLPPSPSSNVEILIWRQVFIVGLPQIAAGWLVCVWSRCLCSGSQDNARTLPTQSVIFQRATSPRDLCEIFDRILIQKSDFEIWVKQRARTKYAVWGPGISCDPEWAAPLYIHQWSDLKCRTQHARVDLYLALFSMLWACTCRTRIRACGARVYIYSGQGIRPYRSPLCILSPLGGPSMCGICWKQ